MQPRPAGKPGGFVNVTTNSSLYAVSMTTNNADLKILLLLYAYVFDSRRRDFLRLPVGGAPPLPPVPLPLPRPVWTKLPGDSGG